MNSVSKIMEERQKYKKICVCGHRTSIRPKCKYILCSWCHRIIFQNKREEFKYRLKESINKIKK